MSNVPLTATRKRILDFDIENMPLTYYAPDYPTAEITAIAMQFVGEPSSMHVCLLGEESTEEMLEHFAARYAEADMVTGHYIRKHDLPILNGGMVEFGFPSLGAKMSSDTKMDLVRFSAIPKNQEFLGAIMKTKAPKVPMDQFKWREANRLTLDGIELTRKRASGDVRQHIQMRNGLIKRGLLNPPKVWRP